MTFVIYHGNCPDGCGAALAAYMALGDEHNGVPVEYIPASYGQVPPSIPPSSCVYLLDFSYPRPVLEALAGGNRLVVLDHHATAKADLEGLPGCHFDMDRSGAVMAWEYFFPDKRVPEFFRYLQDRDLWKFALPESREVSAAVGSYPFDFRLWHEWITDVKSGDAKTVRRLMKEGEVCLRLKRQQVENMARHWRWARLDALGGHVETYHTSAMPENLVPQYGAVGTSLWQCPCANATVFFSEVAEALLEKHPDAPFAAYYSDRADGRRQWGLRSRPEFDCSIVAKAFGGGGHKQAAGFVI